MVAMLGFTSRRSAVTSSAALVIALLLLASFYYFSLPVSASRLIPPSFASPTPKSQQKSDRAYATFLSTRLDDEADYDAYFVATRVLAYQILHHPSTKTNLNIPFVVLVPPHVSKSKIRQLERDGATVIQVPDLKPSTDWAVAGDARFIDQFTKLRLFELTQYEQILYMDSDMLLTSSLDPIWSIPQASQIQVPALRTALNPPLPGEADLPTWYSVIGIPDGDKNGFLAATSNAPKSMNGGFFLLRPNAALLHYYESLLNIPNSFPSQFMEQALLNFAHRLDGPMPWVALDVGVWNCNWPNEEDLKRGCRSLHDKFWDGGREERLVGEWWRMVGAMEGYWVGRNESGPKAWW